MRLGSQPMFTRITAATAIIIALIATFAFRGDTATNAAPIPTSVTQVADSVLRVLSHQNGELTQTRDAEGLKLYSKGTGYLETAQSFEVPMQLDVVAKTDSPSLRLYYGPKGRFIFDWEMDRDSLRIHDPMTDEGKHQAGRGQIPINQFVNITLIVTETKIQIFVDGAERATVPTQCKGLVSRVGVGPALGSNITIKSIKVQGAHNSLVDSGSTQPKPPTGGNRSGVPLAADGTLQSPTSPKPSEAIQAVLDHTVGALMISDDESGCKLTTNSDGRMMTLQRYSVPLHIEFVAKTNTSRIDLRTALHGRVSFNPVNSPGSLIYVDPLTYKQTTFKNAGNLPVNEFVKITWDVDETEARVSVNGVQRMSIGFVAKGYTDRFGIAPPIGTTIVVKSVYIKDGQGHITDSTKLPVATPAIGTQRPDGNTTSSPVPASEPPASEPSATQPAVAARATEYHAPNLDRAPFDPLKLSISADQKHTIAEALAADARRLSSADARTPDTATADTIADGWNRASRFLGIALKCDPTDRAAVILNAEFKRGLKPQHATVASTATPGSATTEPASQPSDPLPAIAAACHAGKSPDDQTLAAALFNLIIVEDPGNEEAMYQAEVMSQAGASPHWGWADGSDDEPSAVPTAQGGYKALSRHQSSIKGLAVLTTVSGQRSGITSDVIATASNDGAPHNGPRFTREVGDEMHTALDEAVRAVRLKYPLWEKADIQISFEDKYSKQDGGSAGGAFATLLMSLLDGFEIDPNVAMTGDVTVDWKIRKIGGLDAKIRAAALDKISYVIVPTENVESLDDYAVLYGAAAFWETQIYTAANLNDVIAIARQDRSQSLTDSMKLFDEVAADCVKTKGVCLNLEDTKAKLNQIIAKSPNNQSARYLRLAGDHKMPTHLSTSMTLFRMFVATYPVDSVLWDAKLPEAGVYTNTIANNVRNQLRDLRRISSPGLSPLMASMSEFVSAVSNANSDSGIKILNDRRAAVLSELSKLETNRDSFEQLRKGI